MVIRGNTRGNGKQLAHYLLSNEANGRVQILDVAGRLHAKDAYLHQTMQSMSLTSELTKSQKGLYHAQINPAYREDRSMTDKDWLKAADILGQELGLENQRRIIVLHEKKGRMHAHVVWERYDHQTGKVIADSFSRLAQDRARKKMEQVFEHQPTPHRNRHRPELKEAITKLWNETETGADFIKAVHSKGYLLAEGVPRHPFMVVDENGRSFDLVRQLKGVRIKEVRQRLRHEKLIPEKEAIELMRQKQDSSDANKAQHQKLDQSDKVQRIGSQFKLASNEMTLESTEAVNRKKQMNRASEFIDTKQGLTIEESSAEKKNEPVHQSADPVMHVTEPEPVEERLETLKEFIEAETELFAQSNSDQKKQTVARQFFENDPTAERELTDEEKKIQKLMQEQREIRERSLQRRRRRL